MAGAAVGSFRARFDSSAAEGMPAHLTVLFPFARRRDMTAGLLAQVDDLAAGTEPFDYRLVGVGRFPRALYLRPDPARAFVELTEAAARRWPDHPPYGGRFATVIPHLTVADQEAADDHVDELERLLPVAERAEELVVLGQSGRRWAPLHRARLGG